MVDEKVVKPDYMGDGVYALDDGYGIWLHANDHKNPTDKIYIEPKVWGSLLKYVDRCNALRKKQNDLNNLPPKNSEDEELVT